PDRLPLDAVPAGDVPTFLAAGCVEAARDVERGAATVVVDCHCIDGRRPAGWRLDTAADCTPGCSVPARKSLSRNSTGKREAPADKRRRRTRSLAVLVEKTHAKYVGKDTRLARDPAPDVMPFAIGPSRQAVDEHTAGHLQFAARVEARRQHSHPIGNRGEREDADETLVRPRHGRGRPSVPAGKRGDVLEPVADDQGGRVQPRAILGVYVQRL